MTTTASSIGGVAGPAKSGYGGIGRAGSRAYRERYFDLIGLLDDATSEASLKPRDGPAYTLIATYFSAFLAPTKPPNWTIAAKAVIAFRTRSSTF